MLIDWFTVGAQTLNFVILVWLMKRYLYKPILDAIDARESKVAAELADADAKKTEAQKERDEFQQKNTSFDQQCAALLKTANEEAKTERERLLEEARQAADDLLFKRDDALKAESENLHKSLARRAQQEVFGIARKALTDLASSSLEQCMAEVFGQRLRDLSGAEKDELGAALRAASAPASGSALVRSAFALADQQRGMIQQAVNETFSADIPLKFDTAPDLISGIELSASGKKIAWSIADYLTSMEQNVTDMLSQKERTDAAASAKVVAAKPEEPKPASSPKEQQP